MKKKYKLITGSAGFIGFHLCKFLLEKKINVIGVDNVNNYYSLKVKKKRLAELKKYKNFIFKKIDISNKKKLNKIFNNYKIESIINLAAQAGVSYSMKYPDKYFKSNMEGFYNICSFAKNKNINKIIYASSSSVYGDNKNLPVKENFNTKPLNYYAITKVNNEETAKFFSEISNTNYVGLRFFSIYGPFGRPDMLIYKLLNRIKNKKKFYLNNYGKHTRDFTYIGDVVKIIYKLLVNKNKKNNLIYNICNSKSVSLKKLLSLFKKNKLYPRIVNRGFQKGDIKDALGCNKKIKKHTKFKNFMSFEKGLNHTLDWYNSNNKIYE